MYSGACRISLLVRKRTSAADSLQVSYPYRALRQRVLLHQRHVRGVEVIVDELDRRSLGQLALTAEGRDGAGKGGAAPFCWHVTD